jgi:hypothetical protein
MKALVVYESFWGNTAAVARAIAEGIGPGAEAVPTSAATPERVAGADLLVAGAPVIAFGLSREGSRDGIAGTDDGGAHVPDVSEPPLRSWLDALDPRPGRAAAFETRIWWSPRGATGDIEHRFDRAGYRRASEAHRFVVEGTYGPLKEGELERARAWGEELREAIAA